MIVEKRKVVEELPEWILRELIPSGRIAINAVSVSLLALNEIAERLPDRYGWRFRTTDAFREESKRLGSSKLVNDLYWQDTLKTCEAYSVMSTWRIVDLVQSCVGALGRDELLCAAITARSALESTAQYVDVARTISNFFESLELVKFSSVNHVSTDLESLLLKTVYASRLAEEGDIYSPKNILTVIDRIAKIEGQQFIARTYRELCEVTHPNFQGRSMYIVDAISNGHPGDETRVISFAYGAASKGTVANTVEAISWACMTHVTALNLMQSSLRDAVGRLWSAKLD